MTPPASTEPMYLISESELTELEIDSSEDTYGCTDGIEIAERIRARGPVQQAPNITTGTLALIEKQMDAFLNDALDPDFIIRERLRIILSEAMNEQQAPAQRYFPIASCYECANRMRMHELYKPYGMMILPEGKESTDFMGRWVCTEKDDQEIIGDEIPSWCPLSKGISSPDHDAALIAQEREKWERERDQKYVLTLSTLREISADVELKDYRKSCIHDPVCQWLCTAGNCPFHVALDRHNAAIATQAREDVLKILREHLIKSSESGVCPCGWEPTDPNRACENDTCAVCIFDKAVESLRSEVKKG